MKRFSKEIGRRCSKGCETWPTGQDYETCPTCGGLTRLYRGVHPLGPEEALTKKRHSEFEDYYENIWVADDSPLTDDEMDRLGIVPGA